MILTVFVITPFNSVKYSYLEYIKNVYFKDWNDLLSGIEENIFLEKINDMVGTINSFQGRQSDIVILMLAGNEKKSGAINWASSKPNLLNVAITRAKKFLYVIGSVENWGRNNISQSC